MYEFSELFVFKFIFMMELSIALHLYSYRMAKKKHYPFRLILSFLICLLFAGIFPILSYSSWFTSLMFLSFFAFSASTLFLIYNISFKQAFLLSIAAYTTQHFAHELYALIGTASSMITTQTMGFYSSNQFHLDLTSAQAWLTILIYINTYFLSYWILYKVFGNKINQADLVISNFSVAIIGAVILLVDIILNAITVYIDSGYNRIYVLVMSIYNLLCCLLVLYIQISLCIKRRLEKNVDALELLLQQSAQQYKTSNENIKLLNIKCHDLKHQIRKYSKENAIDEKYIKNLVDIIDTYDSPVKTGNEALDLILTEKNLFCHKHGINITCLADCRKLSFVSDADLYSLFGNMIDNSIEAVMKIRNSEKREININVRNEKGFVFINIENYYEDNLKLDSDGLPLTTKEDRSLHGFGMKSISLLVDKYQGNLKIYTQNQVFSLSILLPIPITDKPR